MHAAGANKVDGDTHQAEGTQKEVTIDRQKLSPEYGYTITSSGGLEHHAMLAHEDYAQSQSAPLGNHSTGGHTFHLPSQGVYQDDAYQYVDDVLEEGYEHGRTRVLCSYKPSVEAILSQYGRRSPYAYFKVYAELSSCCRVGLHDSGSYIEQDTLVYEKHGTDDHSCQE